MATLIDVQRSLLVNLGINPRHADQLTAEAVHRVVLQNRLSNADEDELMVEAIAWIGNVFA